MAAVKAEYHGGMILARLALGAAAAWGAYTWGAHLLTPRSVWRGPATGRRIALTFDDGPDPVWTPRVLEVLAEKRVPASFFLVGERAARASEIVRRIAAHGHEVASHGWSHRRLWLCGPRGREPRLAPPESLARRAAVAGRRDRAHARAPRRARRP